MDNDVGIYAITSPSGKGYVGSSVRLNRRRIRHFSELKHNRHHCEALQRAWFKYGDQLKWVLLENCPKDQLEQREQFWLDNPLFIGLYNSTLKAGIQTSIGPVIRAKISASTTGVLKSEETKLRMRKPKSPEHAAAISAGKRGKSPVYSAAGLVIRRASIAKAHIALAAKRQDAKGMAHMAMLDWICPPCT